MHKADSVTEFIRAVYIQIVIMVTAPETRWTLLVTFDATSPEDYAYHRQELQYKIQAYVLQMLLSKTSLMVRHI
jgi:hypothetical protein